MSPFYRCHAMKICDKYSSPDFDVVKAARPCALFSYIVHIIYHLYKLVFDRIDLESGTFTREELNPTPGEIQQNVLEVVSRWELF